MADLRPRAGTPASSSLTLAELHQLCRADYEQAAANRAASAGAARTQLALARIHAAEAASAR
ncbi:hypothetical protein [Streptomyces sp. NBC_00334]|uniref:hypothetical protein n=1 Tax=Streptomyces sp. NBC_00334 TaxID=2975713 RepID=UPI002E28B12C|nr:hypothetical protein [Streptomyces sp. NBC_00334]